MLLRSYRLNRSLVRTSRDNQNIRSPQSGNRLAQRPRGQHPLLLQIPRAIEHQDIQITRKLPMLKTIVEQKQIDVSAPLRIERRPPIAFAATQSRRWSRPIPYTRGSKSPRSCLAPKIGQPATTP